MSNTGVIKTVDKLRGFGFISPQEGREVFFHFKEIADKSVSLSAGDQVTFEIVGHGKKRRAINTTLAE